jgi:hypothetical protein
VSQVLAVPVHVAQGDVHTKQLEPLAKVPTGQDATHWLLYKYVPAVHEVQLVNEPEQLAQGDVQASQRVPTASVPFGHVPTHVLPFKK